MEWINCKLELPDDGIDVLLGWDDGEGMLIGALDGEVWRTIYDEIILTPPTHWMQLPDNPQ